jgi:hypothetical protein
MCQAEREQEVTEVTEVTEKNGRDNLAILYRSPHIRLRALTRKSHARKSSASIPVAAFRYVVFQIVKDQWLANGSRVFRICP